MTHKFLSMHLFFIYNSLHVLSTLCSSSGETNCINTTTGNCHSVLVAVSCVGWECVMLVIYQESLHDAWSTKRKSKELYWQLPEYHMTVYQCNVLPLIYNIYYLFMYFFIYSLLHSRGRKKPVLMHFLCMPWCEDKISSGITFVYISRTVNYLAELHIADSKITNPKIYTYKNRALKWQ